MTVVGPAAGLRTYACLCHAVSGFMTPSTIIRKCIISEMENIVNAWGEPVKRVSRVYWVPEEDRLDSDDGEGSDALDGEEEADG